MGMNQWVVGAFVLFVTSGAMAETTTTPTATTATTVAPAAAPAKVIAGIDIRPSFDPGAGVFRTEDSLEFGYQFQPGRSVSYLQAFTTNIHTPGDNLGLNPKIDQGYLRTAIGGIFSDESRGLSFGYTNRIYTPTADYDQKDGRLTMVRNYFNLTQKFSDRVSVTLSEIPILHINSRAGNGVEAAALANAVFQNRIYLTTDIQLLDRLAISIPVMFHQTRYADYQLGAQKNASWDYFVWIYPEITYSLTAGTSVGLAYYSANLIKSDLSGLDVVAGLTKGTVQLALTSYL